MRIDALEVEFSGYQKDNRAQGRGSAITARLSLGSLKQSVQGFDETVGLARSGPGDNTFHMITDHPGHAFHGLDFGSIHVGFLNLS